MGDKVLERLPAVHWDDEQQGVLPLPQNERINEGVFILDGWSLEHVFIPSYHPQCIRAHWGGVGWVGGHRL